MTDFVYHFSDTARLPWILQSGELRPGANGIGGYPDPDFLWATTSERGSRKAAGSKPQPYRAGVSRLVRFTLHATDFEPWHEIVRRYPAWTPAHIAGLEKVGNEPPSLWHCRVSPLPRSRWVEVATKTYISNWQPLPMDVAHVPNGDGFLGVVINRQLYSSRQIDQGKGRPIAYEIRP